MEYNLTLTDKHITHGFNSLFEVVRKDCGLIDFYNTPIKTISGLSIDKTIQFLNYVIIKQGLQTQEYGGFGFGPIEDGGEVYVPAGLVEITGYDCRLLLPLRDFFELALDFARKSLEAVPLYGLKDKGLVDDEWVRQVAAAIPKLEEELRQMC